MIFITRKSGLYSKSLQRFKDKKVNFLKMDYLEVDKEIPDQKYTLLSFLCPDSEMKKRETFMLSKFTEYYLSKMKEPLDYLEQQLAENAILQDKVRQVKQVDPQECFENFMLLKKKELDVEFDEKNEHKTSILGLKVRGSFPTLQEAKAEAGRKQKLDPNHNIFICQTGFWVPFSPNIEEISDQEYACETLNQLMKEYNNQVQHKNEVWNQITKQRIEKAKEEGQLNSTREKSLEQNPEAASSSS
jgi:hypothetical protein